MADVLRVAVLLTGGFVVGMGFPILLSNARLWGELGYRRSQLAAYLLLAVNSLVLLFVALVLVAHYGAPVSWRMPLALLIFIVKGAMLRAIRGATAEQHGALARFGVIDRRRLERRRA